MSLLEKLRAQTESARCAHSEERQRKQNEKRKADQKYVDELVRYLEDKMNDASTNGRDTIFWNYEDRPPHNDFIISEVKKIFSDQGIRIKKIDQPSRTADRRMMWRDTSRRGLEFSWKKKWGLFFNIAEIDAHAI